MKYLLRGWSTMTPFIPLLIVTSLTEVFIEGMEYDDTFPYSIPSTNTAYNEGTMRIGMKGVIVLHPTNKHFIQ
jgi:hypothetical protein